MGKYVFFIVALLLTACTATPPLSAPTAAETLFFPETGHSVQPPFSTFFNRLGELNLLGYPITESMLEGGWTVQYFQFGRLEIHPENDPAYLITVGWLGDLSNRTRPATNSHTEYTLDGAFATFYRENGGSVQFGQPISNPFLENGHIVQDFQSARFIWIPDELMSVALEPIGETYLLAHRKQAALASIDKPTGAITFSPAAPAIAASKIFCAVALESTPARALVRLSVRLLSKDSAPVARYSPQVQWGNQRFHLPPTLRNGHTHLLLPAGNHDRITLYSSDGNTSLCQIPPLR